MSTVRRICQHWWVSMKTNPESLQMSTFILYIWSTKSSFCPVLLRFVILLSSFFCTWSTLQPEHVRYHSAMEWYCSIARWGQCVHCNFNVLVEQLKAKKVEKVLCCNNYDVLLCSSLNTTRLLSDIQIYCIDKSIWWNGRLAIWDNN